MHDAIDTMPTPITPISMGTIDDLMEGGDTSAKPQKVFIGHNLGNRVFLLSIPMHDFYGMSAVANERGSNGEPVAQRKLDETHATKLAQYMLKGLLSAAIERREIRKLPPLPSLQEVIGKMGGQPYLSMQPIVANIRTSNPRGANIPGSRMVTRDDETACFKVMLSQRDILWVVDGQHRRKAMDMIFEFLRNVLATHHYPKKGSLYKVDTTDVSTSELAVWSECLDVARSFCTVTVEAHLGLDVDQERQLFHDLNNLGKKVERSLALQFDSSNPINRYIKEVLLDDVLDMEPLDKDIVNWQEDSGQLAWKEIVGINAILFLNKTNISGAVPDDVDSRSEVTTAFWSAVKEIPGFGKPGAKLSTVAAQPVVLKALAKLTFDLAFSKRKVNGAEDLLKKLLDEIPKLDYSHTNPVWRYYQLNDEGRKQLGITELAEYLPLDESGQNRDLGTYDPQSQVMRFGAKHNDIYPLLGDMFRYELKFPSRHTKS